LVKTLQANEFRLTENCWIGKNRRMNRREIQPVAMLTCKRFLEKLERIVPPTQQGAELDKETALRRLAYDPGQSPYGEGYARVIGHQRGLPAALREKPDEKPAPKKRARKPKPSPG
jgi:hypothetical protein